ncbi:MAG: pyridoxal phosphate-dependent aminotransferase [Solirubrobacterales bacterium]|nr:pyridoxal phosphate-dependent aminotransferase [Solirubrobacterales bacterium]
MPTAPRASTRAATPVAPRVPGGMAALRLAARAQRAEGLIDLSRSEPLPLPLPDGCARAVAEGFERARVYSPAAGLMPARAAAAARASARTGLEIGAERVAIVPGAMAGLAVALRALLQPGDEVIVPAPYFHSYPGQVAMLGGRPRIVDTRADGGELTPAAVEAAVTDRTRALLLCNPSNPAGIVLPRDRVAALLAALPARVAVIADEVYADFLYSRDSRESSGHIVAGPLTRVPEPGTSGRREAGYASVLAVAADEDAGREVVALETASKTAAMPGWRVGSAVASDGLAPRLAQAAATLSGAPGTLAQLAWAAWLEEPPAVDRMAPYRPRLRDALEALEAGGFAVREPAGTYYVWASADAGGGPALGTPETALELARRAGVLVWPGILFGDRESVRISLSVSRRDLREGLGRLTDSWREVREGDVSISGSGR